MKFSLECEVESRAVLVRDGQPENEIGFECDDRIYVFYTNAEGYLAKIKIISSAEDPERYSSRREPDTKIPTFTFRSDAELNRRIIDEFRLLEGLLALVTNGSVRRVKWGLPKFEYLPETEEERKRARLPSISIGREEVQRRANLSQRDLERIIALKSRYVPLSVYLSFYREGLNEYATHRFIYAFYNFYFILEGMYARSYKTVERDFKQSRELMAGIEGLLKHNSTDRLENREKLLKALKARNKQADINGIIELMVSARGDLHHFQDKPQRVQPTTFNHDQFEVLAFIAFYLAEWGIKQQMAAMDREQNGRQKPAEH
jgi:hypothetical protein